MNWAVLKGRYHETVSDVNEAPGKEKLKISSPSNTQSTDHLYLLGIGGNVTSYIIDLACFDELNGLREVAAG
jgi:hypothetical protein